MILKRFLKYCGVGIMGFIFYPVISYWFPPVSAPFWMLARSQSITFDSSRLGQFCALDTSPAAGYSFRLLFAVGTREAKLYALAGIQDVLGKGKFEFYAAKLKAQGGMVQVHIGDTTSDDPLDPWIEIVRKGNLPIYRGMEASDSHTKASGT